MSHEETTGVLAKAVASDVQAIVQALVSEQNTVAGAAGGAPLIEEGEGTVVRAIEAGLAEVEQGAPEPKVSAVAVTLGGADAREDHAVLPATRAATTQPEKPLAEAQRGAGMAGNTATKVRTARVKKDVTKARANDAKPNRERPARKRAKTAVKSRAEGTAIDPAEASKVNAKSVKMARANQALATIKVPKTRPPQKQPGFTVPEVWRTIVKKNERQGSKRYDVLVCQHAVPANDNTYRTARSCPECRVTVQRYADQVAAARTRKAPRRRKA